MVDKVLKSEEAKATDSETGVESCLWETKAAKTDDDEVPVHMWNSRVSHGLASVQGVQEFLHKFCAFLSRAYLIKVLAIADVQE
jgi:hypothetical protein